MACPDCFRGGKAVGDAKGTIETLYGVLTYVATPPSPTSSRSTIVFFTDAFGLDLPNNKVLADAYAAGTGHRVLVPDIIPGGPMPSSVMDAMDTATNPVALFDIAGQVARIVAVLSALWHFLPFFYRARPTSKACFTTCLNYARSVKADLPRGGKLGVAGFCWGGYLAVNLCAQPAVEGGKERLVDASFTAHPSFLSAPQDIVNAVTAFKSPLAVAYAEHDMALPMAKVEEAEADLRRKVGAGDGEGGYYYQAKVYKGVQHGFAVRARPGSEREGEAADEAKGQAVEWFKNWL